MNTPAADGVVCGAFEESFCFHNHAPEQLAIELAFHQEASDEVGGDQLGRAGEEGLGERWGVLGDERYGYGSG